MIHNYAHNCQIHYAQLFCKYCSATLFDFWENYSSYVAYDLSALSHFNATDVADQGRLSPFSTKLKMGL